MSGVLDALDPGYTEGFRFGTNRSMVMSREAIRADIAAIGSYEGGIERGYVAALRNELAARGVAQEDK